MSQQTYKCIQFLNHPYRSGSPHTTLYTYIFRILFRLNLTFTFTFVNVKVNIASDEFPSEAMFTVTVIHGSP